MLDYYLCFLEVLSNWTCLFFNSSIDDFFFLMLLLPDIPQLLKI